MPPNFRHPFVFDVVERWRVRDFVADQKNVGLSVGQRSDRVVGGGSWNNQNQNLGSPCIDNKNCTWSVPNDEWYALIVHHQISGCLVKARGRVVLEKNRLRDYFAPILRYLAWLILFAKRVVITTLYGQFHTQCKMVLTLIYSWSQMNETALFEIWDINGALMILEHMCNFTAWEERFQKKYRVALNPPRSYFLHSIRNFYTGCLIYFDLWLESKSSIFDWWSVLKSIFSAFCAHFWSIWAYVFLWNIQNLATPPRKFF